MNRAQALRLAKLEGASTDNQPYIIAGQDVAECERLLEDAKTTGTLPQGRRVMLIATGVPGQYGPNRDAKPRGGDCPTWGPPNEG